MSIPRSLLIYGFAVIALGGCASSLDHVPTEADLARGDFAPPGGTAADSLVVASYNIAFGERVELAIDELRGHPMLASADVLLLQEMHPEGCNQVAQSLGYDFVYYPASIHPRHDRPFGNAVLTRGQIADQGLVILPQQVLFHLTRRIAVRADLEFGPRRLRAVSLHTATPVLEQPQRIAQVQTVLDSLALFPGPMIIGGDFNSGSEDDVSAFRNLMRRAGFRQVRLPGDATLRTSMPRLAGVSFLLDHLFYRQLRVRRAGIVDTARASDHYPVWAVFDWVEDPSS